MPGLEPHPQPADQQELIDLLRSAIKAKSVDDLRAVLAAGLDPNAKETVGTPSEHSFQHHLIDIVMSGSWNDDHEPMLRALLEAGADPKQAVRHDGETPLMKAIGSRQFKMAQALIEHGDDVNAANQVGWTVVHAACTRGEDELKWLEMLEAAGANFDVATNGGATPLFSIACDPVRLRWMLERVPHRINDRDDRGESVLQRAIEYRGTEGVRIAIEYGADLGVVDPTKEDGVDFLAYAKMTRDSTIGNADAEQAAAMNEIVDFLEAVKSAQSANEIVWKLRDRRRQQSNSLGGSGP